MNAQMAEQYDQQVKPAYKVDFLVRAMMDQGITPDLVLAGTELNTDMLRKTGSRIATSDLVRVFHNVHKHSTDPAIALRVGKQINSNCYGLYGHALLSSPTTRDALIFSINYHGLVARTVRMELVEEANSNEAYLRFYNLLQEPSLFKFNIEFQLGVVLALFRDILQNQNIAFKAARVSYDAPAHAALYTEILECPVAFSQPVNEYVFEKSRLDQPLPHFNPLGLKILLKACDEELNEFCNCDELILAVRKTIMENLGPRLSAEEVAKCLNMTSRTLRRKLSERGTSFSETLSEIRSNLAKKYLSNTAMTIDDIAERVGYSDTANFRNAFKRWIGHTPGNYRKHHQ